MDRTFRHTTQKTAKHSDKRMRCGLYFMICINLKKETFHPRSSAPHSARIVFFSLIPDRFMKFTNFQK